MYAPRLVHVSPARRPFAQHFNVMLNECIFIVFFIYFFFFPVKSLDRWRLGIYFSFFEPSTIMGYRTTVLQVATAKNIVLRAVELRDTRRRCTTVTASRRTKVKKTRRRRCFLAKNLLICPRGAKSDKALTSVGGGFNRRQINKHKNIDMLS